MARDPSLNFSFSGLKTALVYRCRELGDEGVAARRADLAASFQAAVVGQLIAKLKRALKNGRLGGGGAGRRRRRQRPPARSGSRPLRGAWGAPEAGPGQALHRQRGDDRLGRPLRPPHRVPGLPRLRRLRHPGPPAPHDRRRRLLAPRLPPLRGGDRQRSSPCTSEGYRFGLHEIDIESDELLLRRHLERIPVVEVDGVAVSELVLDEAGLRARLDTVGAWSR